LSRILRKICAFIPEYTASQTTNLLSIYLLFKKGNAYRNLVRKPKREDTSGGHRGGDNTKTDTQNLDVKARTGCRDRWWAVVSTLMNLF